MSPSYEQWIYTVWHRSIRLLLLPTCSTISEPIRIDASRITSLTHVNVTSADGANVHSSSQIVVIQHHGQTFKVEGKSKKVLLYFSDHHRSCPSTIISNEFALYLGHLVQWRLQISNWREYWSTRMTLMEYRMMLHSFKTDRTERARKPQLSTFTHGYWGKLIVMIISDRPEKKKKAGKQPAGRKLKLFEMVSEQCSVLVKLNHRRSAFTVQVRRLTRYSSNDGWHSSMHGNRVRCCSSMVV